MERDNRLKRARDYKESRHAFDFLWLKEGGFIAIDEFHDVFSPCFETQDADESDQYQPNNTIVDQSCMQQDSSLTLLDHNLLYYKFDFDDLD